MIDNAEQQKIWDQEHAKPTVLQQMDSDKPSSGVVKFFEYLKAKGLPHERGLEMGCGKGRSVIWLAQQGVAMDGFDFSPNAIAEAKRRAEAAGVSNAHFMVADATQPWPYEDNTFDFAIDCFASTDIVDPAGRKFAAQEFYRTLKPGGHLLAYILSTEDEFHAEMSKKSPAAEKNAFLHSTGKFEKTYDESDIAEVYGHFETVEKERVEKTTEFFGTTYDCKHYWLVMKKAA